MRSLANDRSVVISKKLIKDAVWLSGIVKTILRRLKNNWEIKMFTRILILKKKSYKNLQTSNSLAKNLKKKGCITEKELKYFSIEFKKASNLGQLYE